MNATISFPGSLGPRLHTTLSGHLVIVAKSLHNSFAAVPLNLSVLYHPKDTQLIWLAGISIVFMKTPDSLVTFDIIILLQQLL